MRTLKKVLALSIVLATLFSLTAFAAYTDEAKIDENCVEDVNLLNALNVMQGDSEGTFRPEGTIKRSEAAKMVYVVRTGGKTDASSWEGLSTFTDVAKGAWYEGYVNYCASLGIISGVGNNKFNPDGAVTGVELAKMLLVVAGYKADIQGYTGANWANNVLNDAQEAGLFDGYDWAFSVAAPRQWAAKMFANAINFVKVATYPAGALTVTGALADGRTVGEKYFGLETYTGVALANNYVDLTTASKTGNLASEKKTSTVGTKTLTYALPFELLGQEVTVVYKDSGTVGLEAGDKVYSVYATGTTKVIKTTLDDVVADENTLEIEGVNGGKAVTYTGNTDNFKVYFADGLVNLTINAEYTYGGETCYDLETLFVDSTTPVTLIMTEKNKIAYAFVETALYDIVSAVDVAKGTFTLTKNKLYKENLQELTFGDTTAGKERLAEYVNFVDTVKVGDVVKVSASVKTGKLVYSITKMEAVTGTMSARNSDTKAVIGGVTYYLGDLNICGGKMPALVAGQNLLVYTDGAYAIYVAPETPVAPSKVSANIAYIIKAEATNGTDEDGFATTTNKIQVLLADGTIKTYEYVNVTGQVQFANAASFVDNIVEYGLSNGKFYICGDWSYHDSTVEYRQATSAFNSTTKRFANNILTNDDSYFFLKSPVTGGFSYKVLKASELKTDASAHAVTIVSNNGIKTAAFGILDSAGAVVEAPVYAFVTGAPFDQLVGTVVCKAVAVTLSSGEEKTVIISGTAPTKGQLYVITGTDGVYVFDNVVTGATKMAAGTWTGKGAAEYLFNITTEGVNVAAGNDKMFNYVEGTTKVFYLKTSGSAYAFTTAPTTWTSGKNVYLSVDALGNILAMYVLP